MYRDLDVLFTFITIDASTTWFETGLFNLASSSPYCPRGPTAPLSYKDVRIREWRSTQLQNCSRQLVFALQAHV